MNRITSVSTSRPTAAGRVTAPSSGAARFTLGAASSPTAPGPATVSALDGPALDGLLAAQEGALETARDRAARRHGLTMLGLLADLQRGLLDDDPAVPSLRQLADLATDCPTPDDPVLASLLRACAQRVAVELARRRP